MKSNVKITINLRGDVYDTTKNVEDNGQFSGNAINTARDILNATLVELDKNGLAETEAGRRISYAIAELR